MLSVRNFLKVTTRGRFSEIDVVLEELEEEIAIKEREPKGLEQNRYRGENWNGKKGQKTETWQRAKGDSKAPKGPKTITA